MKFLNKNNGTITILLIILILLSGFMIIRLELKAASLQSRLDEHHNELKNNSDDLDQINSFMRRVGDNLIFIDKSMLQIGTKKSRLTFSGNQLRITMRSGKLLLELSDPDKLVQLMNGSSKIKLNQDNIDVETKGSLNFKVSNDINFGYSKDKDRLYMNHHGSKILVGNMTTEDGKIVQGISLTGNSREQIQVIEDGILAEIPTQTGSYYLTLAAKEKFVELRKDNTHIKMENDDLKIEAQDNIEIKVADDKSFGYDKDNDRLYMNYKGSRIFVGNWGTVTGGITQGITLISNSGTQLQILDKGILLAVPVKGGDLNNASSLVLYKDGNLDIEALGDINITSKNGKVNINGKR